MKIIVETGSHNGFLKIIEIDCKQFYKKDGIRIGEGYKQDVIFCKQKGNASKVIGYFGSTKQRDAALNFLKKSAGNITILDFNEYFCFEAFDDEYAMVMLHQYFTNFNLQKHIVLQLERNKIVEPAHETDAFKDLPFFVDAMKDNRPYYIEDIDKYSSLWAKCIWTPSIVKTRGISYRQYFKYLILKNNEKFSNKY